MVHMVYKHTVYWILAISSVDAEKLNFENLIDCTGYTVYILRYVIRGCLYMGASLDTRAYGLL
jgi:hypothetical protein